MQTYICQFCTRETTNPGANAKHEKHCKNNPNRVRAYRSPQAGRKKGSIPWNKGLSGDPRCAITKSTKAKLSKSAKGRKHGLEARKKMSEAKQRLYASGWECTAGRCPKYDYESPIAGKIKVDGSWELKFCKFADDKKLNWKRNKKRFSYTKPDGSQSTYQPDFYVENWNTYIEVKGYETALDKAKWSQFPHDLIILRKKEIGGLDEWFKSLPC